MARSVFDLLALRQKLEMLRQAGNIRTVSSEHERTRSMAEQLKTMAEEIRLPAGETTAMQLRSSSWYGTRIAEQIKTAENRCQFLEEEIASCRHQLAHAQHRKSKAEEKQRHQSRSQAEEKLRRQEALMPARRQPKA